MMSGGCRLNSILLQSILLVLILVPFLGFPSSLESALGRAASSSAAFYSVFIDDEEADEADAEESSSSLILGAK